MQALFWLKVVSLAGVFGMVLGVVPYLVVGILKGESPALNMDELKGLALLFMLPSVGVWIAMIPGLDNKHLTSAIGRGVAWPVVTVLIAISLNAIFHLDANFAPHLAFILWAVVIPLGVTAGVVMHRVVNAHYTALSKN